MALNFTPKCEEELNRFPTLPDGDYPFTVLESKEQASKSVKNAGRIMCALKLAVHGPDGRDQHVYDYFADWFSDWKLKHFAETTGHGADYEAGVLDVAGNAAQGWTGYVRIITETNRKTGKDRNAVDDYIVTEKKSVSREFAKEKLAQIKKTIAPSPASENDEPESDDVPF